MRFAYADPPYPGQARKHYSHDPRCAEVDHAALIAELAGYDGWALSTSSTALRDVLALCPPGVRVAAWVKPFCPFRTCNPDYGWEPVIFKQPRKCNRTRVHDWVSAPITTRTGTHGAKPEAFCFWLFEILNLCQGDELADLFPGSGAVSRAWRKWERQAPVSRSRGRPAARQLALLA